METEVREILRTFRQFLEHSMNSKDFWEFSHINDLVPSIQVTVIVLTAIAGLYKYYQTKNMEIYQKRLAEVYAPLYKRIVKQEFIRDVKLKDISVEDAPIITIEEKKTKKGLGELIVERKCFLDRKDFITVLEGVNGGLASPKLVTLIGLYESAIYLEENLPIKSAEYCEATIKKVMIELDLFEEIIRGYFECLEKLRLDKNDYVIDDKWEIKQNRFITKYSATQEEIDELQKAIDQNPEIYES